MSESGTETIAAIKEEAWLKARQRAHEEWRTNGEWYMENVVAKTTFFYCLR